VRLVRARYKGLVQSAPVEVEVVQENSAPLFTAAYSYRTQEYARRRTAGSVSSGQVGSMPSVKIIMRVCEWRRA
jgi:hypothetical protein